MHQSFFLNYIYLKKQKSNKVSDVLKDKQKMEGVLSGILVFLHLLERKNTKTRFFSI